MKKLIVFLALVAFLLPVLSFATPEGETVITANGGFRFATINSTGPILVEILANGTASIDLVSSIDGAGTDPNTARRVWPSGDFGASTFAVRSNIPRPFVTQGTSVDSVTVTLGAATEVIVTWTNAN